MADAAPEADLKEYCRKAVEAYKHETGSTDAIDNILKTKLTTFDEFEQFLREHEANFNSFRSKHDKVYRRIREFLGPIIPLAKTGFQMVNGSTFGLPVSVVLGVVIHLVQTCKGVSDAFDWIEQVFVELNDYAQRFKSYMQPPVPKPMERKVAQIIIFIIRVIARTQKLIADGRFRRFLRLAFLGEDRKTKLLVEQLNQALKSADSLTIGLTYAKVGDLDSNVLEGNASIKASAAMTTQVLHHVSNADMLQNLKIAFFTQAFDDNNEQFSRSMRALLTGSGGWLSEERLYKTWKNKEALILWILGGPGSGKTMLCTWLIHHLNLEIDHAGASKENLSMAYFFMRQDNKELRTVNNLFKTMIWQLQQSDPEFKYHVGQVCQSARRIAGPEQIWESCFLEYYTSAKSASNRVILVIDGLDEADPEERSILLNILDKYRSNIATHPKAIQFVVFGREELRNDLKKARLESDRYVIKVSSDKNSKDLNEYIKDRIDKLLLIQELRKNQAGRAEANKRVKYLQKQVYHRAEGVFLWAQIFLDQMQGQEWGTILGLLKNPPLKLDGIIYSVLDRLSNEEQGYQGAADSQKADDLEKTLIWVCASKRPLSFVELESILRLYDREPRRLLWGKLRDNWASVFNMQYPRGYDPDLTDEDNGQSTNSFKAISDTANWDLGLDIPVDRGYKNPDNYADNNDDEEEDNDEEDSDSLSFLNNIEDDFELERSEHAGKNFEATTGHYDIGQLYTTIAFAHARFRDVVREQGDLSFKGKATLSIFKRIRQADYYLFIDCVYMLHIGYAEGRLMRYLMNCMAKIEGDHGRMFLSLEYPSINCFLHLDAIHFEEMDADQKLRVIDELYWLLRSAEGCHGLLGGLGDRDHGQCDDFWRLWFIDQKATTVVQRWFSKVPLLETSPKTEWISQASISLPTLLEPLARAAAQRWLKKRSYDDIGYLDRSYFEVWFLKAYTSLTLYGEVSESCKNFNWMRDAPNIGLQPIELEDLAGWAKLEETTHWHSALGWTLFSAGHDDAALEHCQKAIELDDGAWVAMEARARVLAKHERYSEAIEQINVAMSKIPDVSILCGAKACLLSCSAEWNDKLGNYEERAKLAEMAFSQNIYSIPATTSYIDVLAIEDKWEELMRVLRLLHSKMLPRDASRLTKYFATYGGIPYGIKLACAASEDTRFVLQAAEAAIPDILAKAVDPVTIYYFLDFAEFCYDLYGEEEKFIEWFTKATARLEMVYGSDMALGNTYREPLMNKYARICFDMAVAHQKNGKGLNKSADRLKKLATIVGAASTETMEEVFELYSSDYVALLWGRWVREYVKMDELTWKKCFRSRVLKSLAGLDDNDPENDKSACQSLAIALFQAGDRRSAAEILAVIFKQLEERAENPESTEEDGRSDHEAVTNTNIQEHANTADETAQDTISAATSTDKNKTIATSQREEDEATGQGKLARRFADSFEILSPQSNKTFLLVDNVIALKISPENTLTEPTHGVLEGGQATNLQGEDIGYEADGPTKQNRPLELHLSESWGYRCDWCRKNALEAESMWFCEICFNTNFCSECLVKVKNATLGRHLCSPNHVWYQAWPIPDGLFERMAHSQSQGNVVLKKEWLDNLRNQWLIDVLVADVDPT